MDQEVTALQDSSFQPNFPAPAPGQPIDELALAEIKGAILAKLRLAVGKDAGMATKHDWYQAAALALRDRIVHRWLSAERNAATMPGASASIISRSNF
ncbi:glucan phosphorylase [Bradyrhizobium sp. LB7.1]